MVDRKYIRYMISGLFINSVDTFHISKAGLGSWYAIAEQERIKIYETHSASQAEFIESITGERQLAEHFPRLILREGKYIVSEWVKGKEYSAKNIMSKAILLNRIVEFLVKMHNISCDRAESVYDYSEFLKLRLERFIGPFIPSESIQFLLSCIKDHSKTTSMRVHHPDISPSNIIWRVSEKMPIIIDNELLSVGSHWMIDLFNMSYAFRDIKGSSDRIIRAYVECGGDLKPLIQEPGFYIGMWGIRRIGSLLQKGSFDRAYNLADDYQEKIRKLDHPIINSIRKLGY